MKYALLTPPETEPVTVSDIKTLARVEHAIHDALLGSLITSCRQWIEYKTDLCMLAQEWQAVCNGFPEDVDFIEIWKHPINSVDSVGYYDTSNTLQTLSASDYFDHLDVRPALISLNEDGAWPADVRRMRSVVISFTAGFGSSGTDCPVGLIEGLKNMVVYAYENPGTLERFSGDWSRIGVDLKFLQPYLMRRL